MKLFVYSLVKSISVLSSVRDAIYHPGLAGAYGLAKDEALKSVTANPILRRVGSLFVGCLAAIFLLSIATMIVLSTIGLTTGYLYLPPSRGGGEIELYGMWARIVSAIILLFFGTVFFLVFRNVRKRRRPKILGD